MLQLPLETDIASEDRPLTSPKTVARVFRLAEGDLAVPRPLSAPTLRSKFKTETLRTPSGEQRDCPSRILCRLATSQFDSTLNTLYPRFGGGLSDRLRASALREASSASRAAADARCRPSNALARFMVPQEGRGRTIQWRYILPSGVVCNLYYPASGVVWSFCLQGTRTIPLD